MTDTIPRIVHQTWKTDRLPAWAVPLYRSWDKHNPEYEHWLWTDEDLREIVRTHYPWFLKTYDSYDLMIQRVDAARYFILHRFGGVYVDLDFECYRSLDTFTQQNHDIVLSKSSNVGVVTNALMMSRPGHPFWLFLAKRMQKEGPRRWFEPKSYYVLRTTGPLAVHRATKAYGLIEGQGLTILDKKFFFPYTMFEVNKQQGRRWASPPASAYGAHHHMCTWTQEHHIFVDAAFFATMILLGVILVVTVKKTAKTLTK